MSAMFPATLLIACGEKGADTGGDGAVSPDDEALIEEAMAAMSGYEGWTQIAPFDAPYEGTSPHGIVQIWWNDVAMETINAGTGSPLPVGSVIVKESYTDTTGSTVSNVTAMYKQSEEYGWWWGAFDAGVTEATMYGQPDYCVDCHIAGQDYSLAITW